MKQHHILLFLSTIILIGSLILLVDDSTNQDAEWKKCFPSDFYKSQTPYEIELHFQDSEKNILQFTSNLQNLSTQIPFPPKFQVFENAVRTIQEMEISSTSFDSTTPSDFGLGNSSILTIIINNPTQNIRNTIQVGNNTQVGYGTYVNCNGTLTYTRNTINYGIPQDIIEYKDTRIFPYTIQQIKGLTINDISIEKMDTQWYQIQPHRSILHTTKVDEILQQFLQYEAQDITEKKKTTENIQALKTLLTGSISLTDHDIPSSFSILSSQDTLETKLAFGTYNYALESYMSFPSFEITELYSTSLHPTIKSASRLELFWGDNKISSNREEEANEKGFFWNDDARLYDFLTKTIQYKRIPHWTEKIRSEQSCAPDVIQLGSIRVYNENRFFEYQICQITDMIYLTSSFEDGIIQVNIESTQIIPQFEDLLQSHQR